MRFVWRVVLLKEKEQVNFDWIENRMLDQTESHKLIQKNFLRASLLLFDLFSCFIWQPHGYLPVLFQTITSISIKFLLDLISRYCLQARAPISPTSYYHWGRKSCLFFKFDDIEACLVNKSVTEVKIQYQLRFSLF